MICDIKETAPGTLMALAAFALAVISLGSAIYLCSLFNILHIHLP